MAKKNNLVGKIIAWILLAVSSIFFLGVDLGNIAFANASGIGSSVYSQSLPYSQSLACFSLSNLQTNSFLILASVIVIVGSVIYLCKQRD